MRLRPLLVAIAACMLAGCVVTTTEVVRTHPDARPGGTATSAPPAGEHVVARGETLYAIAFRSGLDWRSLASWNNLGAPYTIYPGQRLRLGPAGSATATAGAPRPPVDARPGSERPAGNTQTRPIAGQTPAAGNTGGGPPPATGAPASGSASRPGVPAGAPAGTAQRPQPGSAPTDTVVAVDTTQTATPSPSVPSPTSPTSQAPAPAATPTPTTPQPPTAALPAPDPNAPSATVGGIRWRWPTQGEVIQRFTGSDLTRQGIDIAGRSGQAVVAAADGEVVYSGSGLRGYGELIIIKHSADYLSAYGHNRKRLVAEGQRVTAGQPIAELGRTGTDRDKLHFEIRHSGKPVDPLKYLPRR